MINLNSIKNGAFRTVETKRAAKLKKGFIHNKVEKITKYKSARLGINYDNLQDTQHNRYVGISPKENKGLPWGKWKKFPVVIEHNGKDYIRLYAKKENIETSFTLNGKIVSKKDIDHMLMSSEKTKEIEKDVLTITVKAETITKF